MPAKPAEPPSLLSQLFFTFVTPIIRTARQKGSLEYEDIPLHTARLDTAALFRDLDETWAFIKAPKASKLAKALAAQRKGTLVATGIGYGLSQACSIAGPILLGKIVSGLACVGDGCDSRVTLYLCASGRRVQCTGNATSRRPIWRPGVSASMRASTAPPGLNLPVVRHDRCVVKRRQCSWLLGMRAAAVGPHSLTLSSRGGALHARGLLS